MKLLVRRYPIDLLYEEVAYIAYYLHWPYHEIMNMDHRERQRWCKEVSKINEKINKELLKERTT